MLPHTGELVLILAVALIIFGLGRLPHYAEPLARLTLGAKKPTPPPSDDSDA